MLTPHQIIGGSGTQLSARHKDIYIMDKVHFTIESNNRQIMQLTREVKDTRDAIDLAFKESRTLTSDITTIEIEVLGELE